MEQWNAVHRTFTVEKFIKNNNSVVHMQKVFSHYFNVSAFSQHDFIVDREHRKNAKTSKQYVTPLKLTLAVQSTALNVLGQTC